MENYESKYGIGDTVSLNFFKCGVIENCVITGVKFKVGKVLYDVGVPLKVELSDGEAMPITIIENVDSVCVTDEFNTPNETETETNNN